MPNHHTTDVIIIGAGPCGLFAVFEAGMLKLHCHLVDYLPTPGGQCAEIYPKKPIYDIPAHPSIMAGDLIANLVTQIAPFKPQYSLGERAESLEHLEDGTFRLTTLGGIVIEAPTVLIAGGLGCFEPRKPVLDNLAAFENAGVDYIIKDPEKYRNKNVVVAGGGDSALDWTIVLADIAASVALVHRSQTFRAAPDSVEKAHALAESGKITLLTDSQVTGLHGNGHLEKVTIAFTDNSTIEQTAEYFIPLFGLSPKLGPIATWGLGMERHGVKVDPLTYMTSVAGIYAVGDIAEYPNKLKLILSGFHEAAVALHSEYQRLHQGKKHILKYSTITGITGFES
ncbi:MAG: NAD(P)/FAD-dependent oxidoreductase [bacterium]|nr:NAD(P)/FAD-dependent oxidoreductase [bacterium]